MRWLRWLSDLVVAPAPQRGDFVGREAELREFRNSVRYLLAKDPPPGGSQIYPHVLLVHGEGGMGKSALVRQWLLIAGEEAMPDEQAILLDLDSAHCPTSEALAQLLADAIGKKHPNFDQRYRAACHRRDELAPAMAHRHARPAQCAALAR